MDNSVVLSESNPYANGRIFVDDTGEEQLDREPITYAGNAADQWYTVRTDDMLDAIAWRFYKNTVPDADRYWWILADVNDIENPLDLSAYVGREILIPDFLTVQLQL